MPKGTMRAIVRILGWLLLIAALVLLGLDLLDFYRLRSFEPMAAGQVWFRIDAASLNLAQAVVQRYLHPALWDPIITWILTQPAFAVTGLPGLFLAWLGRAAEPKPRGPLFRDY
jgi:hypothetical protein